MVGIIVAFANPDNAANIRNLLMRGGIQTLASCTSGTQAIQYADSVDEGIVICGYQLKDMLYSQLREFLSERFEVLLISSAGRTGGRAVKGVISLAMPVKVYDLLNTVNMLLRGMEQRRKKKRQERRVRNPEQEVIILKAKALLMERNHLTEEEAHRYLQKNSMDSGTNMVEMAEMVLSIISE
ncbi:MAG: ANTAR domain-containing protein [Lachnospiraceae bacterium]|nr:ANTAR domain-containing protein [Lachnospiraceae bacterium]